jgi:hypothetical protein
MAFSFGTNGTTGAMTNVAPEQGAADDFGREREGRGELGPFAEDCLLIHLYI